MVRLLSRQRIDEPRPRQQEGFWQAPKRFNFTRDVVEAVAHADPHRPALASVDREGVIDRLTFKDIALHANQWAGLFRSRGLAPGDRVLVVVGKKPAWHAVLLGALKAGLVAVPCSELLPPRGLAFRGEHTDARIVVTDRERAHGFELIETPVEVMIVEEAADERREFSEPQPTHETSSEDIALILYTSGTSGEPKGALHTHAYTWANHYQARDWLDVRRGDVVWCTASTGSAKAIWNTLLGPWSCGAETVIHDSDFDPEERLALISRMGVTVLCQTPTEYRLMAQVEGIGRFDLRRLRHVVSAGEPLNAQLITHFHDLLGLTIYDGYGQAENTVLVANTRGTTIKPGSMGLPTPGHDVSVIDDDGNVQPVGVEGELALRGWSPSLFRGYWNAPEETSAVLSHEHWYLTGDRAARDEDGYLWFAGRADDMIVSAAHRVDPVEVENVLIEHPAVAESAVVGKPDREGGQIVKAFIVLESGFAPSPALALELQEHVSNLTAPHTSPREIEFVNSLLKTPSGKISRGALRELARTQANTEALEAEHANEEVHTEAQRDTEEAQRSTEQPPAQEQRRGVETVATVMAAEAAAQAKRDAAKRRRTERAAEKKQRAEEERHAAEAAEAKRDAAKRRRAERAAEKKQRAEEERHAAEAKEDAAPGRNGETHTESEENSPVHTAGGRKRRGREKTAGGKGKSAGTQPNADTTVAPDEDGSDSSAAVAEAQEAAHEPESRSGDTLEWRTLLPGSRTTAPPVP